MTLSKQLLILISIIFLLIFSVNFIISVDNIRSYLQIESSIHAQDTATSLGLSLSPHIMDETDPILETMMLVIFDRGYFKEIKLLNVDQKPLVTLRNNEVFEEIPSWFIELLPMQTATAASEISSGWSIGGTLLVTINPGYGYLKLYEQASSTFYYSLGAFFIAISCLFLLLRLILQPLKKIEIQARTIAKGDFTTIKELPWTTEVKNVALAMNIMSAKIAMIITNLNNKLEALSHQMQLDDLTGLHQKNQFITDLKQLFIDNVEGHVIYLKIDTLAELAEHHGSTIIDRFLIDLSDTLKQLCQANTELGISAYRFYGSEFALIVNASDQNSVQSLATSLSHHITQLGKQFDLDDLAHLGIAAFNHFTSTKCVLDGCLEAYEQARLIGKNSFAFSHRDSNALSMDEWKNRVQQIIDNKEYQITFINQAESLQQDGSIVMTEAFTQVNDPQGNTIPTGTFIAIAEKIGKVIELDRNITEYVIEHIQSQPNRHAITINLSLHSVRSRAFQHWLTEKLVQHAELAPFLTFSLTAYAAIKDIENFKHFITIVHKGNAKILLKRYENQLISLESLKQYNLDYIRLAQQLTADISHHIDKKAFLETLQALAELLDIKMLAEQVSSDADFEVVKTTGLYAASR